MFHSSYNLSGYNATKCFSQNVDKQYARIDTPSNPSFIDFDKSKNRSFLDLF